MNLLQIIAPQNINEIGWLVIYAFASIFTYTIHYLISASIILLCIWWYFFAGKITEFHGYMFEHQSRVEEMRGITYTYGVGRDP